MSYDAHAHIHKLGHWAGNTRPLCRAECDQATPDRYQRATLTWCPAEVGMHMRAPTQETEKARPMGTNREQAGTGRSNSPGHIHKSVMWARHPSAGQEGEGIW